MFAGVFLARGMVSALDRVEALSYWVVSDHFEELGRPPALIHGGFGLRTVGELRKPRWWALALLERLRRRGGCRCRSTGDGAGWLVEPLATYDDAPARSRAAWNLTLDQGKAGGSAADRSGDGRRRRPGAGTTYTLTHHRVDAEHSNVATAWGGAARGDRTGRTTSSGRRCARPTGSTSSSRARDASATTVRCRSASTCRCRRCPC